MSAPWEPEQAYTVYRSTAFPSFVVFSPNFNRFFLIDTSTAPMGVMELPNDGGLYFALDVAEGLLNATRKEDVQPESTP